MEQEPKKMKPIWYFVGLMLTAMGVVIVLSGITNYSDAESSKTVLSHLHPALWWGVVMIVSGVIFLLANRKASVE